MDTLYFDVGNTQIKWLYRSEASDLYGAERSDNVGLMWAESLRKKVSEPKRIAVSCVKSSEYLSVLISSLKSAYGLEPFVANVLRAECGVVCSYDDPSRMGIDRWLAMVAVRSQFKGAFCVIDCGSAATFDWVDAEGNHVGGFILPGLKMSVSALLQGTDQVVVDADRLQVAGIEPGVSTTEAVYNGVLFSFVSQIESAFRKLMEIAGGSQVDLVLTGGDAKLLTDKIKVPHKVVGNLVFIGLEQVRRARKG